ncbi:MAG: hypothetical protein ACOZAQ_02445 [Pseudomonadota bacterium]
MKTAQRDGLIAPILESLEYCFATILLQTDDLLFALAGGTQDGERVNLHLDTLRFLRTLRTPWPHRLSNILLLDWMREDEPMQNDMGLNEASWHGLETFARHVEALHLPLIESIRQRLRSPQARARPDLPPAHGLDPKMLTHALGRSLAEYNAPPTINTLVIRLLDQLLAPALGDFYQEVDDLLAGNELHSQNDEALIASPDATGRLDLPALLLQLERIQNEAMARPEGCPGLWSQGLPRLPDGCTIPPELKRPMELMGALIYGALSRETLRPQDRDALACLYLPLLKAALIDPAVISDLRHPVRRLWQELGDRLPQAEAAEHEYLLALTEALAKHFKRDLGDFSLTLEALRAGTPSPLAQPEEPPAAPESPPPPARGHEAPLVIPFAEAREAATESIRQALAGRRLPDGARAFLLRTWGPLLLNLAQGDGIHSAIFEQASKLMHNLARQTGLPVRDLPTIFETLNAMQSLLEARQLHPLEGAQAIARLREELQTLSQCAAQTGIVPRTMPATRRKGDTLTTIPAETLDDFLRAAVQPGEWFLVYLGEEQPPRRLKIFHIDKRRGAVVLADRFERPILDRPLDAFIDDALANRTRPVFEEERHGYALDLLRQQLEKGGR